MKRKNFLIEKTDTDLILLNIPNENDISQKKLKENICQNNKIEKKDYIDINKNNLFSYSTLDYTKDIVNNTDNNQGNWPKETSILCWWCCHSFAGSPIPIPKEYDKNLDKFKVYGNFCSFNCAKRYLINTKNNEKNIYLLCYLNFKLTGNIEEIRPAPPREVLKSFGGILDIDDFRTSDSKFYLVNPPFLPYNSRIQEEKIEQIVNKVPKNTYISMGNNNEEKSLKKLSNLGIKTIKKKL